MNDNEFFVSRSKNPFLVWAQALIFMAAVGFVVLLYLAAGGVAFVPAPFILFLAYWGVHTISIYAELEFEYSLSGNILNIDRIYKQVRRKPLLRVTVNEITAFGRMDTPEAQEACRKAAKIYFCDSREPEREAETYYMICPHEGKGEQLFVIEPNERMLASMRKMSPVVAKAMMTIGH